MRRGEALGLEWEDVDFQTGVISIKRTSQYTGALGTFTDETKTEQSKRSLRVPMNVIDVLNAHRVAQNELRLKLGDRWQGSRRIFTNADGSDMSANIPLHRLKSILKKNGLREVSLHSLRHTNATLLIQQGISIRAVSGRLGHSQTSTTMNIYAHQIQSADAAAADALDIALSRGRKQA